MLSIPEAFQARLDAGATRMCWCWRVTRRDSMVFGFTEHDRDLAVDGVTYCASTGFAPGDIDRSAGFAADHASVFGALSADAITESDLMSGIWDGATVDLLRVDWSDPSLFVAVWRGELGETRRGEVSFEADLLAPSYRLDRTIGRLYSRRCDAELGDKRCGVDLDTPAFSSVGVVSQVIAPDAIAVTGLEAFDAGHFADGHINWTEGENAGVSTRIRVHRKSGTVTIIEFDPGRMQLPQLDDAATFKAGCDKCLATCRDRFANVSNFQGFPFIPGNDVLIAAPGTQSPRDGGSRGLGQ